MRSPWKVIAGFVSRRDSQISHDTVAEELPTAPDTEAEKRSADEVESYEIVSFERPISRQHLKEVPTASEDTSARGFGQPTVTEEKTPASSEDGVEPVLATTIRLVTKDRLSARAAEPGPTPVLNALEDGVPDVAVADKTDIGEPATAYSESAAEDTDDPKTSAPISKSPRINGRRSKRTPVVGRPKSTPERRSPSSTVDASSDGVVGIGTFVEAAMGLDGEVAQLRYQLAQKLRLQNEQLKQLLARYDAR